MNHNILMAEKKSYASVHWKDDERILHPVSEALISVAKMEDTLRTAANTYAANGDYEYAQRVCRTGSELSHYALIAIENIHDVAKTTRNVSFVRSIAPQLLSSSCDNADVPPNAQTRDKRDGDSFSVPSELYELYTEAWQTFTNDTNLTIPIGRASYRNGENFG